MPPRRRAARRRRAASSTSARKSSRTRARRSTAQSIDVDAFTRSVAEEVVPRLGLDILGLSMNDYVEILKPIVAAIIDGYSSRPSKQAVVQRLLNSAENVYKLAAIYLVERFEDFTEDQLEFIVSNAPDVAAKHAPRLYEAAKRLGRDDIISMLRSAWEVHGVPSPIPCPRCGFRAVTPDLVCMVCGYELSEKEAKEMIDFEERLREMVEFYGQAAAREAAERGYVIVGEYVKPPSAGAEPGEIVLHLSPRERELLEKLASMLAARRRGA